MEKEDERRGGAAMNHEKLLPCPFCGGEAKPPEEQTAGYWVECTECKSRGSRRFFEIAAIAAWNRRTPPAAVPAGLPAVPDDDSDFTPELARKIIAKYQ